MLVCFSGFIVCISLNILYYNVLYPSQGAVLKNEYQKCLDALHKAGENDAYITSKLFLFPTFFAFMCMTEYPRFLIIRYLQTNFDSSDLILFVSSACVFMIFNYCLTYFNILKSIPVAETANRVVYSVVILIQFFIVHFVAYQYDHLVLNVSFRILETILTAFVVKKINIG